MKRDDQSAQGSWIGMMWGFGLLAVVIIGGGLARLVWTAEQGPEQVDGPFLVVRQPDVIDGKDVATGLVVDQDWELVKGSCLSCHSAKLITQNRMSRDRWEGTIRWMQETQNLGDLYDNEPKILDYLARNYAPKKRGRRPRLENIEAGLKNSLMLVTPLKEKYG
ncbi:MAG: hypothetical protein AAF570_27525, partial [Bacteroidota bacterium]